MKVFALALLIASASIAHAQEAIPDLKGTWVGTSTAVVFGNNGYHPGTETPTDPPRVREVGFTMKIEGQQGRVLWGEAWATDNPAVKDTLALAIASDNKTIVGADNDGAHYLTLVGPDRIERCYAHPGTSPSHSIVAACGFLERQK